MPSITMFRCTFHFASRGRQRFHIVTLQRVLIGQRQVVACQMIDGCAEQALRTNAGKVNDKHTSIEISKSARGQGEPPGKYGRVDF